MNIGYRAPEEVGRSGDGNLHPALTTTTTIEVIAMANAHLRARAGAINTAYSPFLIFLFSRVLASLSALIDAERDMLGMSGQDPALDRLLAAAEAARAIALARLRDLSATASGTVFGDVGELFIRVMTSDDPGECAELFQRAMHQRHAFLLQGSDPISRLSNQMIHRALAQLETYGMLEHDIAPETPGLPAGSAVACDPDFGFSPAA
jgi:hypothetical protein